MAEGVERCGRATRAGEGVPGEPDECSGVAWGSSSCEGEWWRCNGCEANGVVVTLWRRQFRVVELQSGKLDTWWCLKGSKWVSGTHRVLLRGIRTGKRKKLYLLTISRLTLCCESRFFIVIWNTSGNDWERTSAALLFVGTLNVISVQARWAWVFVKPPLSLGRKGEVI